MNESELGYALREDVKIVVAFPKVLPEVLRAVSVHQMDA